MRIESSGPYCIVALRKPNSKSKSGGSGGRCRKSVIAIGKPTEDWRENGDRSPLLIACKGTLSHEATISYEVVFNVQMIVLGSHIYEPFNEAPTAELAAGKEWYRFACAKIGPRPNQPLNWERLIHVRRGPFSTFF